MNKIILVSTDTYLDLNEGDKKFFKKILIDSCSNGNSICFVSRDSEKLGLLRKDYEEVERIYFKSRYEIKQILDNNDKKKHLFVVLGSKNKDFELAVNNKLLFLVPLWNKIKEERAIKYGVHIDDLDMLNEVIESLNNQNKWFYELELDERTKVYSLICAHSKNWCIPSEEKKLVEGFEDFLKRGNGTYYKVLLCHFLAFMSNNPEFRDIDHWAIMPSSGIYLNKDMYNFKEIVRFFMKGNVPRELLRNEEINNVFLRNTPVKKSHQTNSDIRMDQGATVHLKSIHVNDAYRKGKNGSKLEGKNICVFDDYLTHGNSFEALRNILKKAGASKIIFVSLGKFRRDYIFQEYDIKGDVFTPGGFNYELKNREMKKGKYSEDARGEVRELANIFAI
ncbi:phosphoribosyltransferase [Clostridium sp.]|uniref:phosphoribosyltransferase n=1 Tax=Clostridium sp. TaxID=1506 RepID=UPI003217B2A6